MVLPHVVVLCDDSARSRMLVAAMESLAEVCPVTDAAQALRQLGKSDTLVVALRDPLSAIVAARRLEPSIPVVAVVPPGDAKLAIAALKAGAADVLVEPLRLPHVRQTIKSVLAERPTRAVLGDRPAILGESEPLRRMMDVARQAARSRANVLIEGESGTGKGVLAEFLSRQNPLLSGAFVKINCTAIPESLLEAELFGYEPGAFTGAVRRKVGRVEMADGGTLFLDEIGIAPLTLQAKLLRFLQDGEFERLGGVQTLRVRTRVVSATNTDLKAAIRTGQLREDLYYRLDVIHIRVPALRERSEDIPLLVGAFLEDAARKNGRGVPRMRADALDALVRYSWPGNIRELQNLMERLVVLDDRGVIVPEILPPEIYLAPRPRSFVVPVGVPLREVERRLMDETLRTTGGDKKLAAELLGVHPRTIYRHLEHQKLAEAPETSLETPVEGGRIFA